MRSKSRAPAIVLLLVIATGLWAISAHLDSGSGRAPAGREAPPTGSRGHRETTRPSSSDGRSLWTDPSPALRVVEGRVVDPAGRPIPGVLVRIGPGFVRTDSDGGFVLARTGSEVLVSHEGFFPLRLPVWDTPPGSEDPPRELVLFAGSRVEGRVRDDSGRPVPEARVHIARSASGGAEEVTTDPDGRWRSALLTPGPVHLLFLHEEYQSADRVVSVPSPGLAVPCDVTLRPGEPLRIRVATSAGRALPDATVWLDLDPEPGVGTAMESRYLGRTGDLGWLRTRRPPRRSARVRARLAGYRETRAAVTGDRVDISLEPAPRIEARAIDAESGLPIRPLDVRLELLGETGFQPAPDRGVLFHSLSGGKIRVGLPPLPGLYRLVVTGEERAFGVSDPIDFDGERSPPPATVPVRERLELAGTVESTRGPVEDADVEMLAVASAATDHPPGEEAEGLDDPRDPVLRVRTSRDGEFVFTTVPRGTYRLSVRHPEHAEYLSPAMPFPPPGSGTLRVRLHRPARLSGEVLGADGHALADVPVVVTGPRILPRIVWSDAHGVYTVDGLPPGDDYRVRVGSDDPEAVAGDLPPPWASTDPVTGVRPAGVVVEIAEGTHTVYDVRSRPVSRGSLDGRVRVDGEPLACALRIEAIGASDPVRRAEAADDGTFLVRNLRPGSYRLTGVSVPFVREVSVAAGERSRAEIEIRTLRLGVELTLEGGEPPVSGTVEVVPLAGPPSEGVGGLGAAPRIGPSAARLVRTVEGGRASFDGLYPGRYEITVRGLDCVTKTQRMALDVDRDVRVVLERGTTVTLRLQPQRGGEFRGMATILVEQDGRTLHRARRRIDGSLRLPPLPSGDYQVTVRGEDGSVYRKTIPIPSASGERPRATRAGPRDSREAPTPPEPPEPPRPGEEHPTADAGTTSSSDPRTGPVGTVE